MNACRAVRGFSRDIQDMPCSELLEKRSSMHEVVALKINNSFEASCTTHILKCLERKTEKSGREAHKIDLSVFAGSGAKRILFVV